MSIIVGAILVGLAEPAFASEPRIPRLWRDTALMRISADAC